MIRYILSFALLLSLAWPAAAADLSKQNPVEVRVALGTKGGELVFSPNALSFETGKLYKLVVTNPSPYKHYFSALRFATAVWTRKVETEGAEIKGAVREIELKPGGSAEWFFVPVQAGTFNLKCTIPGHAEAGMVGKITVK
ncbi:MAG: plastocyanin/azurin family copper-binding protein [Kiloniellaceae bacterium]